jgi:hypothetical protein
MVEGKRETGKVNATRSEGVGIMSTEKSERFAKSAGYQSVDALARAMDAERERVLTVIASWNGVVPTRGSTTPKRTRTSQPE